MLRLVCCLVWVGFVVASSVYTASNPNIQYVGRVDFSHPSQRVFDWSCVKVKAMFDGTTLAVRMNGGMNFFNLFIDGQTEPKIFETTDTTEVYYLATGLPPGNHSFELVKRTEVSVVLAMKFDVVTVESFLLDDGCRFYSLEKSGTRKLEFFGDSDTNGFGIEGPSPNCLFDHKYENCYVGWAAKLSRALNAEFHMEAMSGRGVVKNAGFNLDGKHPMPFFWDKTLGHLHLQVPEWDFQTWIPDAVFVYLGSNDFTVNTWPPASVFEDHYLQLLEAIRNAYLPKRRNQIDTQPKIINICGGKGVENQQPCAYVSDASTKFNQTDSGNTFFIHLQLDEQYPQDFGCIDHRNVYGQQKVFEYLLPLVKQILHW